MQIGSFLLGSETSFGQNTFHKERRADNTAVSPGSENGGSRTEAAFLYILEGHFVPKEQEINRLILDRVSVPTESHSGHGDHIRRLGLTLYICLYYIPVLSLIIITKFIDYLLYVKQYTEFW